MVLSLCVDAVIVVFDGRIAMAVFDVLVVLLSE